MAARTERNMSALRTWYQRLEELWEYKQVHGHCKCTSSCLAVPETPLLCGSLLAAGCMTTGNVPQKYDPNKELGKWVNKQRSEKKAFDEHENTSMTLSKRILLEGIGFEWAKQKGEAAWNKRFQELSQYRERHGHSEFSFIPPYCLYQ